MRVRCAEAVDGRCGVVLRDAVIASSAHTRRLCAVEGRTRRGTRPSCCCRCCCCEADRTEVRGCGCGVCNVECDRRADTWTPISRVLCSSCGSVRRAGTGLRRRGGEGEAERDGGRASTPVIDRTAGQRHVRKHFVHALFFLVRQVKQRRYQPASSIALPRARRHAIFACRRITESRMGERVDRDGGQTTRSRRRTQQLLRRCWWPDIDLFAGPGP